MRLFIFLLLQVMLFLPLTGLAATNNNRDESIIEKQEAREVTGAQKAAVIKTYGKLPLYFIKNKGQVDKTVSFYERGAGHATFFTEDGVVLSLTKRESKTNKPSFDEKILGLKGKNEKKTVSEAVSLSFVGANKRARITADKKMSGHVNYFIGKDKTKWRTGISTYGTVTYHDIYKNIDVKFYGNNKNIERDVIVRPGGDFSKAIFAYRGIKGLKVTEAGDLEVSLKDGKIIEQRPVIYQEIDGRRVVVEGAYRLLKGDDGTFTYGFTVAAYDHTKDLVIDPMLVYSTYLGGSSYDSGSSIALDSTGAVYVLGTTASTDFPLMNPMQGAYGGGFEDAFVTKINPAGTALVYSTYFGGSDYDYGNAIAVDSTGAVYATGSTRSTDFPLMNPIQGVLGGYYDAFVTKINPSGTALVYSTYFGGSGDDYGNAIAVDSTGAVYFGGFTDSTNFPLMNPIQGVFGGWDDAFIAKINPSGTALVYSTYLGGSDTDYGNAIAVDSTGAVYAKGTTHSTDFPLMNPIKGVLGGYYDAFVTKINPSGTALVYSTYLGGSGSEFAIGGIAVDSTGAVYVVGTTDSTDFPLMNPIQGVHAGFYNDDAFVTKINPAGTALVYSTYLGGSDKENVGGIAVDSTGAVYVVGTTLSTDFPLMNPIQDHLAPGGGFFQNYEDGFVTKINPSGTALVYSTYHGGNHYDSIFDIAVDSTASVYVTGGTGSTNFPIMNPIQGHNAGGRGSGDAFITKINDATAPPPVLTLTLSPDVISIARGSSFGYGVTITNTSTTTTECFDYWENVTMPFGNIYPPSGDLFGWNNICLAAGATLSVHFTHGVPMNAPIGVYVFNAYVGTYQVLITSEDHFNFNVTAFNPTTKNPETSWRLIENGFRK